MKRYTVLFVLMLTIVFCSSAKKDINAWKSEKNLDQQYIVFKNNLNFWNGSYFLDESQLNQFYDAITDSIFVLEKTVQEKESQINSLQNELDSKIIEVEEIQKQLNKSIKLENSIDVFGMNINKNVYSFSMYIFILGVLILAGFVFLMFKRSNTVTIRTKKDYNEIKEEFEVHKKNSLDRYTKMNMELHKTRMELNKK